MVVTQLRLVIRAKINQLKNQAGDQAYAAQTGGGF